MAARRWGWGLSVATLLLRLCALHGRAGGGGANPAEALGVAEPTCIDEVFLMQFSVNGHDDLPTPYILEAQHDGPSGAAELLAGRRCAERPGSDEATSNYVTDNSRLQHVSKGIAYCFSKDSTDTDPGSIAFWGSVVQGVEEGDGWLRVGGCYLPMTLDGKQVIFKATDKDYQGEPLAPPGEGFPAIQAVEASDIPGGTRFTLVTGDNSTGTDGHTYHVDVNGSLANISDYSSILESLVGQVEGGFLAAGDGSAPVGTMYASLMRMRNSSRIIFPSIHIVKQIPVWEIRHAIDEAVQEGIRKAEAAAEKNHSKPTMDAVSSAVSAEVFVTWNRLAKSMWASRFRRRDHKGDHRSSIATFFKSVRWLDWCLLTVAILLFTVQHYGLLHVPSNRAFHGTALVLWFIVAGLFCILIFKRQGTAEGILWLNGYILELIFLVENVLVIHIIIHAFRTPKWVNEKALFIVVIARIIFQMIFYMGFAELVFSGEALPYVLGVWLLYIAWQAALDDDDSDFNIMDARVIHLARAALGERLWLSKENSGALFVVKDKKRRLSLVGLMVFCVALVDALLHVDVALTKIEELQGNGYLCFSSAAIASFCMPELVFVTRDLFRRFPGLKYGISAVLVYISVQMLLHAVFRPPVFVDLIIFVGVLVLSAMLPAMGLLPRRGARTVDAGTQVCLPPPGHDGALIFAQN
mmetsp:Transcript_22272/g.61726  ORF Transcript_22272/g.61726 Transcript_22272/m.61726 type:complete len:694 (-) Transcript_22272:88-2169(-)